MFVGTFGATFIAGISSGIGFDISPLGIVSFIGSLLINTTSNAMPQTSQSTGIDFGKMFSELTTWASLAETLVLAGIGLISLLNGIPIFISYLFGALSGFLLPYSVLKNNQAMIWTAIILFIIGGAIAMWMPDKTKNYGY